MNKPKASPSCSMFPGFKLVGAGLHKLPGESVLENPSTNITNTRRRVDKIPITEANDSTESGIRTVGTILCRIDQVCVE